MKEIRIIGLLITDRIKEAGLTQNILTRNAHLIKTRLGFHEVTEDVCSRVGMILLQVSGPAEDCIGLENELRSVDGLEVRNMVFQL